MFSLVHPFQSSPVCHNSYHGISPASLRSLFYYSLWLKQFFPEGGLSLTTYTSCLCLVASHPGLFCLHGANISQVLRDSIHTNPRC